MITIPYFLALYAAGMISSALCAYWWARRSWREGYRAGRADSLARRQHEQPSHINGGHVRTSRARYRFE